MSEWEWNQIAARSFVDDAARRQAETSQMQSESLRMRTGRRDVFERGGLLGSLFRGNHVTLRERISSADNAEHLLEREIQARTDRWRKARPDCDWLMLRRGVVASIEIEIGRGWTQERGRAIARVCGG